MLKQITITNLTGLEPYSVSLCDNLFNNCMYVDSINDSDIPYFFIIPSNTNYGSLSEVGIKVIDSNGCIVQSTISIT